MCDKHRVDQSVGQCYSRSIYLIKQPTAPNPSGNQIMGQTVEYYEYCSTAKQNRSMNKTPFILFPQMWRKNTV